MTAVTIDQFAMTPEGIEHLPTGAKFTPRPGSPFSGTLDRARLGEKLANGDDYPPDEVQGMMEDLWAEYVLKNDLAGDLPDLKPR
jgi:hypothetical protein